MAFTTPSYALDDLFARINRGELQLPDFQRNYSWDVDRIHSVIVTVLRGYPIGALLALDTRNEPMRFRPRPITGAPAGEQRPGLLLLDGQQRLTSLYHSFQGDGYVETVDFRGKNITRRFFVDITRAVAGDVLPEDAVFTVDENGHATSHFAPDLETPLTDLPAAVSQGCVPVDTLLGPEGSDFLFDTAADADEPLRRAVKDFHHRVVAPLAAYDVPMIRLSRETASAGVGSIFAQANSVGLQMDVFELLTAVFATEDAEFSFVTDADEQLAQLREHPVLDSIGRTEFLTAMALVVTSRRGRAGGQREDILTLTLQDWRAHADDITHGFLAAAQFLEDRAIFTDAQVPYQEQIPALAAILALVPDIDFAEDTTARDRLSRWFWCGVLGELYGRAAVDIRSARDVEQVVGWVKDDTADEPKTVTDAQFTESRLLSVDSSSAVWRGLQALLMARGARDWRTGKTFTADNYAELRPGFEPIFPLTWCENQGIDAVYARCVLNHTPMGRRTEVVLSGYDPVRYLPRLQSKAVMDDDEFDEVLASHELDPQLLHSGDAREFFVDRRRRFVGMVEYALDRAVKLDVDDSDIQGGSEGPNAFA